MGGLYNAAAWGQQTGAARLVAAKAFGSMGGMRSARKRRRKAKASASSSPRRRRAASRTSSRRGRARLVKGSAAAKRYMAKIRRMRKRR